MTASVTRWAKRWRDEISAEPVLPGVWLRKAGGFRIRGRAIDVRTGKLREVNRTLPDCKKPREAAVALEADLAAIRAGSSPSVATSVPSFANWAATVLERKIASGDIASAAGRAKWDWALRVHLVPAFGPVLVDRLTREDFERWKVALLAERKQTQDAKRTRQLASGRYTPETANTIIEVLRQVMGEASDAFNFADPCRRLSKVSKRGHRTYTYEEPNAIKPDDVPRFLEEMRVRYPDHYAFVFLGFTTGLRPSSLRPLRRCGPNADVKWDEGNLLVRRSHTRKAEVMDSTKTNRDQVIALDARQIEVLRWHVQRLEHENAKRAARSPAIAKAMGASELLFPASPTKWNHGGGFRSPSCLDKAFASLGKLLELGYDVSPRCMRRTYQDLARAASVGDIVTRSISGHATPEMQRRYSTVSGDEMRAGMGKVIDLATARARRAA